MSTPREPRPDRRRFLTVAAGVGVTAAAGWAVPSWVGGRSSTGRQLRSTRPLPAPYTLPLVLPAVLAPTETGPAGDVLDLTQRLVTAEVLPGTGTELWTYGGSWPGPTIESRRDRPTRVRHRNELPVPTVCHLHGGHTPSASDGFPTDLVLPAGTEPDRWTHAGMHDPAAVVTEVTRHHDYPNRQRAATLWYHDHRMDFTGPAVYRGLAGFHLVRDDEEDALGLPGGDRELCLMIADRAFGDDAELLYPAVSADGEGTPGVREPWVGGVLGDVVLVNGVPWPTYDADAARHRLRLLNGSNARRYDLVLDPPPPDGSSPFVQVGSDGGLLAAPQPRDSVLLAPAERADVVVDLARYPVGTRVRLLNRLGDRSGGTGTSDVMELHVARGASDDASVPSVLSELETLEREDAVRERSLTFAAGRLHDDRRGWLVGGRAYDPSRTDVRAELGSTEIWRVVADVHHPVHLHLNPFQVLRRGRGGPSPADAGWKDTVDLRPGESVELITRIDGYRGRYVFHCHNLEHEDMGMMANLEVV